MAIPFLHNIDLNSNQILNLVFQNLSTAPASAEGKTYYDTATHTLKYYNGTSWVTVNDVDVSAKADKVTGATNGNFAGLDASGNLTDSGKKAADFDLAGAAAAVLGASGNAWATNKTVWAAYNYANAHVISTANPHGVTASQVGLGNVTNESKATMFASPNFTGTATYNGTELATKADISSVFKFKGSLTYAQIIALTTAKVGDVYLASDQSGKEYVCVVADTAGAGSWELLGIAVDLSAYALTANVIARVTGATGFVPKLKADGQIESTGFELLKTVPANALFTDTVYTHPTTAGNKHIPSGGSTGQILKWSADGTAIWAAEYSYTHPAYTARTAGLYKVTVDALGHVSAVTAVVKADITALGIPAQDTTYSNATTSVAGLMSTNDKIKLDKFSGKYAVNNPALTPSGGLCTWTITHNLGTRDVIVDVSENSGDYQQVFVEIQKTTINSITILLIAAATVAVDTYRATIIG